LRRYPGATLMAKPLTAIAVAKARAKAVRRELADGGCRGLYLVVQPSGVKSWAARYRSRRRSVKFTLGPVLLGAAESGEAPQLGAPLSLAAARELCARVLREAKAGRDPAAERRHQRDLEHAAESDTLRSISEEFLRRVGPGLRTAGQRAADLALFYPALGALPISEIRRGQFTRELDRIADQRGLVRADRALAAMKRLLAWHAERSDYASVLGRGGRRVRAQERVRSRVLDDGELRKVWLAAERFGLFGDLVRFLLLTCARRNEAAGLKVSELSPDGTTWILPAARCKGKRDVAIPLSVAAQRIIVARGKLAAGDYVFSTTGRRAFNDFARAKAAFDKACGVSTGWRIHDLRRTARTLLSRCGIAVDIAEQCLGHVLGGIRGTYDKYQYLDEKRHAFEALGAQIARVVRPPAGTVVPIGSAKARRK
jgi:integrase